MKGPGGHISKGLDDTWAVCEKLKLIGLNSAWRGRPSLGRIIGVVT